MTLDEIALKHGTDKASSHHSYCPIYEFYFSPLRDKPIRLLEQGVQFGASIKTWLEYFPSAHITGVDILDQFKCDDPRYEFAVGDHGSCEFWESFRPSETWDIIIDDGCHRGDVQAKSFLCLWPRLNKGGYHITEDWFTTYHEFFNPTAVAREWLSDRIGDLNQNGKSFFGNPWPKPDVVFSALETDIDFIHLYRGLVIIKKK